MQILHADVSNACQCAHSHTLACLHRLFEELKEPLSNFLNGLPARRLAQMVKEQMMLFIWRPWLTESTGTIMVCFKHSSGPHRVGTGLKRIIKPTANLACK